MLSCLCKQFTSTVGILAEPKLFNLLFVYLLDSTVTSAVLTLQKMYMNDTRPRTLFMRPVALELQYLCALATEASLFRKGLISHSCKKRAILSQSSGNKLSMISAAATCPQRQFDDMKQCKAWRRPTTTLPEQLARIDEQWDAAAAFPPLHPQLESTHVAQTWPGCLQCVCHLYFSEIGPKPG